MTNTSPLVRRLLGEIQSKAMRIYTQMDNIILLWRVVIPIRLYMYIEF